MKNSKVRTCLTQDSVDLKPEIYVEFARVVTTRVNSTFIENRSGLFDSTTL